MPIREKVLFVDDAPEILIAFTRNLGRKLNIETAEGPEAGLAAIREKGPFAVVVSDLKMAGEDGISFLEKVRTISPDTVRIILTGHGSYESAINAVNRGAVFRFLKKPISPEVLVPALGDALKQYRLVTAERELLRGTLLGSVKVLVDVLSLANPHAFSRSERFREMIVDLGKELKLNAWQLDMAAMLCQLGCVAVSDDVVRKVAAGQELTSEERQEYCAYPKIGSELLAKIPRMGDVSAIIGQQLQDYSEEQMPAARLLRVVLDYDMLEARGIEPHECLEFLERSNEKRASYDPEVLEALRSYILGGVSHDIREVAIADIKVGMVLASDYMNAEGTILFKKGSAISDASIKRLNALSDLLKAEAPLQIIQGKTAR